MNTIKDLCVYVYNHKDTANCFFNREIQKKYDKNGGYYFFDFYVSYQENTKSIYYAIIHHTNFINYVMIRNKPVHTYIFKVLLPDIQISILFKMLKEIHPKHISYEKLNNIFLKIDAMWIAIYEQIHNRKMIKSC
jgi:hypothetical protein